MHLRKASDLKASSCLEKPVEVLLGHGDFTPVHEDQEELHVFELDVLQECILIIFVGLKKFW